MPHYVYIIQSQKDNSYYKGYSKNPLSRLAQHNSGESTYTSQKIPWALVYVEEYDCKTTALIRERSLKKYANFQIRQLIHSSKNMIAQFR